jgi:hypothetical protein
VSTPDAGRPDAHKVLPPDQVARGETLRFTYPEASYAVTGGGGWFCGALRDVDDAVRASSLERMIDRLMARETERARLHDDDARNRET